MRKIGLGALAIAIATIAAPASAQIVSGTINVSGTVAPKCQVVSPGPASQSFLSTVDLGDISRANGTLEDDGVLTTRFNAGGIQTANLQFQIVCTTAAPFVTVDADPILNGAGTAPTGYSARVDYTSQVTLDLVNGGSQAVSNLSSAGAPSSQALNARLVTGQNNLTVTATGFTAGNASDVLVAGAYSGVINITIAPST